MASKYSDTVCAPDFLRPTRILYDDTCQFFAFKVRLLSFSKKRGIDLQTVIFVTVPLNELYLKKTVVSFPLQNNILYYYIYTRNNKSSNSIKMAI